MCTVKVILPDFHAQHRWGGSGSLEDAYSVSAVEGKQTVPQAEIDKHLEMGRLMLSKGQLQDALSHYHAAVGKL